MTMVRGWCPGALRPMESGDGLIVRLRISGGIVDIALARQIAQWSRRWGNGQLDLSNRANLQLRGFSERQLPDLHHALAEWGLLDGDAPAEAVRNVVSSPLSGLDPSAALDIRPTVRNLEQRLAADALLHELPGKFGFAIDDGGRLGLDDVAADIRFVALHNSSAPVFAVHLAGAARGPMATCGTTTLPDVAAALAGVFLRNRTQAVRRMRDLVDALGPNAIVHQAGLAFSGSSFADRVAAPAALLGVHPLGFRGFLGIGLRFGQMAAEDLGEFARAAAANGARELRLTPWRAILVPVPSISAARSLSAAPVMRRFILASEDPRRRIAACPGAPACVRGTTPVRGDAARLTAAAAGTQVAIHVSGCQKGCAHPHPAPLTLVGRNGRYDLVRDGAASDAPALRDLTLDQVIQWMEGLGMEGRPVA